MEKGKFFRRSEKFTDFVKHLEALVGEIAALPKGLLEAVVRHGGYFQFVINKSRHGSIGRGGVRRKLAAIHREIGTEGLDPVDMVAVLVKIRDTKQPCDLLDGVDGVLGMMDRRRSSR